MKKALVMTVVLVLGLGFAAFADGTLSGVWDTDISLYPAASEFGDFIKSFTTAVDVDYTIGGWVFGMESTFSLAGFSGMDFNADGVLGAFEFDFDLDFSPMVLTAGTPSDVDSWRWLEGCGGITTFVIAYAKPASSTYTAAFDDMKAGVSVSIAGVNLSALFFLEGVGNEYSETMGALYVDWNVVPVAAVQTPANYYIQSIVQTGSYVKVDPTKYGAGWKFTASGSFGGATLTGLAYFNLYEYSTYDDNSGYADVYLADKFTKSGTYYLACSDCIVRFTQFDILLEDVSFACATFDALASFDCCGFSNVMFLVSDVGLGCCWDVNFDLLITFSTTQKNISIEPDITLANACFTIDAVVEYTHTEASDFTITGVRIRGFGLEYSWNGITFTAATSWDLNTNPILGDYDEGYISSPAVIQAWEPDADMTQATFTLSADGETCTLTGDEPPVDMTTGDGYWQLTSIPCEKAYAWEKFGIEVDGDSCCGGAFDISAVFYFGNVKELTDLDGVYYFNANHDTTYDVAATPDEDLLFFGDGLVAGVAVTVPGIKPWSAATDCDSCDEGCSFEIDEVEWTKTYALKSANRLFDWVKTAVDVEIGIGSAFDLTFGLDVSLWGWEDFTFGFEFTF